MKLFLNIAASVSLMSLGFLSCYMTFDVFELISACFFFMGLIGGGFSFYFIIDFILDRFYL